MVNFKDWDYYVQQTVVSDFGYDYVNKIQSYYNSIKDDYDEKPSQHYFKIRGSTREKRIFSHILIDLSKLIGGVTSYYVNLNWMRVIEDVPIADEDVALFKQTINLYEENYNDRVTNIKAAFEQRKLESLQSGSVSGEVPKPLQRKQSVRTKTAVKPKRITKYGVELVFTPIKI